MQNHSSQGWKGGSQIDKSEVSMDMVDDSPDIRMADRIQVKNPLLDELNISEYDEKSDASSAMSPMSDNTPNNRKNKYGGR